MGASTTAFTSTAVERDLADCLATRLPVALNELRAGSDAGVPMKAGLGQAIRPWVPATCCATWPFMEACMLESRPESDYKITWK